MAAEAPDVQDERRTRAIESVHDLFRGFVERFGDTDCRTLTGCDWSTEEGRSRWYDEEVYKDKCYHYFEYVLVRCMEQVRSADKPSDYP